MTLYGSLDSKSSLVDIEHLPKVRNSYSNHQPHTSRTNQDCGLRAHTCVCSQACFQRTETTAAVRDLQPVQVSVAVCFCQDPSANDQAVPCLGLPALFQSHSAKKARHPQLTGCRLLSLVKFKVWLWKRNTNHNGVSIQNLCSIISSSKKFSDALRSLWKTLFNPRKLY